MFNFDVVQHEVTREPWEFEAAGKRWRLPHIAELTIGQKRAADHGFVELVVREVAEVFDEDADTWVEAGAECAVLIMDKHEDQVGALKVAWLAHAGMEPGESPASSR